MSKLQYKNFAEKLDLIKSGKLSLVENVKEFLTDIEKKKDLNAYNFLFEKDAIESAEKIQKKIINGNCGKLAGMVLAIKDVISIDNKPLSCSSNILKNFNSIYNATVIDKLIEEDAIIIGKTNCDEFAMGGSNENSAFGPVLNPINTDYVPGGSSGGSAAAVAANLCDVSLGTDTGGSIRQPAAFCGIYGLKPTYGRVSRYGLTAFASSFDSIGPFAKNIDDLSLVLNVISGFDEKDSTSIKTEQTISTPTPEHKFKIGIPKSFFNDGLDSEINSAIQNFISSLKNHNVEIIDIELPHTEYSVATYYILTTAEASSNLARFDAVRFGHRSEESTDLNSMYTNSKSEAFGKEVKRRIMLGTYVLSAGYYDAYYKKAQQVRRLFKNDFDKAFEKVDLILTPTTPTPPFKLGEMIDDPLQMYLMDIYTTPANLVGLPGINIPINKNLLGLPIGVQLMANQFEENKLLNFTKFIQENII